MGRDVTSSYLYGFHGATTKADEQHLSRTRPHRSQSSALLRIRRGESECFGIEVDRTLHVIDINRCLDDTHDQKI